jgi:hypothetical protein
MIRLSTTQVATQNPCLYGLIRRNGMYVPQWDSNQEYKTLIKARHHLHGSGVYILSIFKKYI